MPRKKKKAAQRDTRGYARTSIPSKPNHPHRNSNSTQQSKPGRTPNYSGNTSQSQSQNLPSIPGQSTRKVNISQQAQEEIAALLGELQQMNNGQKDGMEMNMDTTTDETKTEMNPRIITSVAWEDPKVIQKIAMLNDALTQCGFNSEQILRVFVAISSGQSLTATEAETYLYAGVNAGSNGDGNGDSDGMDTVTSSSLLTLDHALDWLCMHLTTEELPRLFTDVDVVSGDDDMLTKVQLPTSIPIMEEEKEDAQEREIRRLEEIKIQRQKEQEKQEQERLRLEEIKRKQKEEEEKKRKEEAEAEARKQWLLQQYQYEEDDDEENNDGNDDKNDAVGSGSTPTTTPPIPKSVEEVRLEKLEDQIQKDTESLADEAANYMRSKYEVADLKKRLKKSQQMAKGLRNKIEKKKVKEREIQEEEEREARAALCMVEENDSEDEGGYGGGLFDLFGESSTAENDDTATATAAVTITKSKPTLSAEIPKGWTGKNPKELLLEHCRKRKVPKPSFTKMPDDNHGNDHGCIIRIRGIGGKSTGINASASASTSVEKNDVVVSHAGPFCSFKDGEQYVSTKALYEISSDLPLYQLLPPIFRDLWKSWLSEKEAEKVANIAKEEEARNQQISDLIKSIRDAVGVDDKDGAPCTPSIPKGKKEKKGKSIVEETEKVHGELGDWEDDESWSDDGIVDSAPSDSNRSNISRDVETNTSTQNFPTKDGERLRVAFHKKEKKQSYRNMKRMRQTLPMYQYRQELLDTVNENAVTVLCAETGAGKTTQCPQFLLEEAFLSGVGDQTSIICTQPRRISALSVAERVAEEMDERIGQHVGYHIRMETKRSKDTKLMFCTTGVVLRRLQDDPDLKGVTHVIVDECHERQWQIDFLLIALRRMLQGKRKDLKVILMSATLDSKLFCSFFQGAPFLSIPGRTFPVNNYYLEDILEATNHIIEEDSKYALRGHRGESTASMWITGRGGEKKRQVVSLESELESLEVSDLYDGYTMATRRSMEIVDEQVINYDLVEDLLTLMFVERDQNTTILPPENSRDRTDGSILVFLPGLGEIRALNERLKGNINFGDHRRFEVIPMHSTLSPKDQKRAFMKTKPGCRKIILATNIAETSVTIADCVCVIDTGLCREVVQNKRSSTSTLITDWCSRASAKQRAGRAGRVQPGICCKMYSSNTANVVMKKQATPELQRVPLEEVCLSILAGRLSDNCMGFLLQAPQPPSQESVKNALQVLEEVGAIHPIPSKKSDARLEQITPLGSHLAKLPVHVRLGKMLIFGALFKVLDKVLTIVASLTAKSVFSTNIEHAQQASVAHKTFLHHSSDFLTICNVWEAYTSALEISASNARKFCTKHYLNRTAFVEISDMRRQFFDLLQSIGFIDSSSLASLDKLSSSAYNKYAPIEEAVSSVITAGLYPNVAHCTKQCVDTTPSLFAKDEKLWFHKSSVNYNKRRQCDSEWVVFHEKFATSKTFVSTTTFVQPFSLLLFGESVVVRHTERKVIIDDWIVLHIPAQAGVMFRELRRKLSTLLKERMDGEDFKKQTDTIINGLVHLLRIEARDL